MYVCTEAGEIEKFAQNTIHGKGAAFVFRPTSRLSMFRPRGRKDSRVQAKEPGPDFMSVVHGRSRGELSTAHDHVL